jgi:hypothetical protein
MVGPLVHLCERASDVVSSLPPTEQADARRLLELCQRHAQAEGDTGQSSEPPLTDLEIRELARLVEYLSRRNASGIPLATLGRAVLAHRAGHTSAFVATCKEVEQKLSFLGF